MNILKGSDSMKQSDNHITLYMKEEIKEKLIKCATIRDMSFSEYVRFLILNDEIKLTRELEVDRHE